MGNRSKARLANGVISALLVAFFLAHGVLGSAALAFGFFGGFAWLVWAGVALVVVHVAASVVTSREQLTDSKRPPSARKKRHLMLKWGSGLALAACAFAHAVCKDALFGRLAIVLVAVALAVHVCVGAKSLLSDLFIDRRFKMAFRVVVCAFTAVFTAAALASFLM